MSYLTMVFKEPISEEVRAVLRSAEWTASSWSHAIHERDAMAAERDALRAENAALLAANKDCVAHFDALRSELATTTRTMNALAERSNAWRHEAEKLRAELEAARRQEPVGHQFQDRDGNWCGFINDQHYQNTKADGTWPIRAIYAAPVPAATSVPEGWVPVPDRLISMFCNAADNLGDMPISDAWADKWSNEAGHLLEQHDYFRDAAPKPEGA